MVRTRRMQEVLARVTDRRRLLAAGAAAAGAALTGSVLSQRPALALTGVSATSGDSSPAISGTNTDGGPGVEGDNTNSGFFAGPGLKGVSQGVGVQGIGFIGVAAESSDSTSAMAVRGDSVNGVGVFGAGGARDFGFGGGLTAGVVGISSLGPGVLAVGSTALRVAGKASFTTVGSGTLAAGATSATVSDIHVTVHSHVTVTLTESPGEHVAVSWVERQPGAGFVVHTTRLVSNATRFTYFIVEP